MPPRHRKRTSAHNQLLAALPTTARRNLVACGESVELKLAAVLCEPGAIISHVFFPIDCSVTRVAGIIGRSELEAGLVGDEGMLGATLLLGVEIAPLRWLVQGAGRAWKIEAGPFLVEVARSPLLRSLLDRYLYVTMVQLAQASACKRFHVVETRLARWLLMTRDRAHADNFHVTHEDLARIMGVRRAGITRAASSLQQRRLIRYTRGEVEILDGDGLEAASCDCYEADSRTYASVMG